MPYATEFVGATRIMDASGTVLATGRADQGPAIVYADVTIGAMIQISKRTIAASSAWWRVGPAPPPRTPDRPEL